MFQKGYILEVFRELVGVGAGRMERQGGGGGVGYCRSACSAQVIDPNQTHTTDPRASWFPR